MINQKENKNPINDEKVIFSPSGWQKTGKNERVSEVEPLKPLSILVEHIGIRRGG